jgi:hypothetical protein
MISKRHLANAANVWLRRFGGELVDVDEVWKPTHFLRRQPRAGTPAPAVAAPPILKVWGDWKDARQDPFDFAVVIPSLLRKTLAQSLRSVFKQDFPGRIQILVGIDVPQGGIDVIDRTCEERPPRQEVLAFWPGYSTSVRHGGLHPSWDGGVLRTLLTYLANSRYVAYLDDDNWWAPDHLNSLKAALIGHDWAYSKRWFVHPDSREPICVDEWESLGPGLGEFASLGGFVDPTCLALDKIACESAIRWWSIPMRDTERAMDADRNVFRILASYFRGQGTNRATAYYVLDKTDHQHPKRLRNIGENAYARAARRPPQVL